MSTGDNPGVRLPPPFIFMGFLLLGWGLDFLWPAAFLAAWVQYILGGALFVLGVALARVCILGFRSVGTDFKVDKPSTALFTGGPYRYSRNPIYIALSLAHLGVAVAADSAWMVAMLVPALAVVRFYVIAREERYLEGKFGDDYRRYLKAVRRWF